MTEPGPLFCCTMILYSTSAFLGSLLSYIQNPGSFGLKTNQRVSQWGDKDRKSCADVEVSADWFPLAGD